MNSSVLVMEMKVCVLANELLSVCSDLFKVPTDRKWHLGPGAIKAQAGSDSVDEVSDCGEGGLCRVIILHTGKRTHRKTLSFAHTLPLSTSPSF